jgi:peptidoglycan/xylan/chitin deacetylase (PgdA/CDA1 family)
MRDDRLTILTYHAIDERKSVISVSPALFRRQMELLAQRNIQGISLAQAFEYRDREGRFPDRSVVVTIDDGYLSVYEQALPVLASLGMTATVFLPTDFIGLSATQARLRLGESDRERMNRYHIEKIAQAGFEIAAHSMSHPDLTRLPPNQLEREIALSGQFLEKHFQCPVRSFAYPYGHCDKGVRNKAADHYDYACTTELGHNAAGQDPLLLKRLDAYYLKREWRFIRACEGGLGVWWVFRQALRDYRRKLQLRRQG